MCVGNRILGWELRIMEGGLQDEMKLLEQFRILARRLCYSSYDQKIEFGLPENVILHGVVNGAEVDLSQIKIKPGPWLGNNLTITTDSGEVYATEVFFATRETQLLLRALLSIH